MKTRPVYENLDTSFVNLSALIKFLRRRQFAGSIRVELTNYEADITLVADKPLRVREYDRAAGRISEGEESLQRLLIRAREPNGVISVYGETGTAAPAVETPLPLVEEFSIIEEIKLAEKIALVYETVPAAAAEIPVINIIPEKPPQNGHSKKTTDRLPREKNSPQEPAAPPDFPFVLNNIGEDQARRTALAPADWQMLLNLTAELLKTIERTLAEANLEFAPAFEKARAELAVDYPFINPAAGIFDYKNGKIVVRRQINAQLFAAAVNEALRRILTKLGKNPKFLNVHLTAVEKIILLIEKRKPLYEKFHITPHLSKTIGI